MAYDDSFGKCENNLWKLVVLFFCFSLLHHILLKYPQLEWFDDIDPDCEELTKHDLSVAETGQNNEVIDNIENNAAEDSKWYDSESQNLLDSQQLVEALSLCDDLLQSQSPKRDGENGEQKERPSLSVYAHLGPELLKKDIEECQNLVLDTASVELDTPPSEFRLSQLVFSCSQFIWN